MAPRPVWQADEVEAVSAVVIDLDEHA